MSIRFSIMILTDPQIQGTTYAYKKDKRIDDLLYFKSCNSIFSKFPDTTHDADAYTLPKVVFTTFGAMLSLHYYMMIFFPRTWTIDKRFPLQ